MIILYNIKEEKTRLRRLIWDLMERRNISRFPRPVYGRIPNFVGAEEAAKRALSLSEWRRALVVKVNPDSPQRPLRELALQEGKKVIMATPRLRRGFIMIDPAFIPNSMIKFASTIKGAFRLGRLLRLREIPHIDLIITGCVAVDRRGNRLGKGGGYAEIEYAILRELGVIDESTPVITTVHDIQIVDHVPREEHDLTVDIILTPTKTLRIDPRPPKPKGIYWNLLGEKKDLPVIKELQQLLSRK